MLFKKKKYASAQQRRADTKRTIGKNLNFAAAEAYRLLRTNLDFSLPDVSGCKVIGVTSSLPSEGKSTTAINIAYTMAETGQNVLLLEADLRLPTLAKKCPQVHQTPGITNLLAGQCKGSEVLQPSKMLDNLWMITAGEIPPNPAELLNSKQMEGALNYMKDCFDVIIVDLPPVSVVSDAMIISRLLSGIVIVTREGVCTRRAISETIRQFKFTDCKILGFVVTGSSSYSKKYGYYSGYYYKK